MHQGFLLQTCSKPPIWHFRKWQPHLAWVPQTHPNRASGRWLQKGNFLLQFILFLPRFLLSHGSIALTIIWKKRKRESQKEGNSIRILVSVPCWGGLGRVEYPTFPLLLPRFPRCSCSEGCRQQHGACWWWQPSIPAPAQGNTYTPLRLLGKHEFSNSNSSLGETLIFYLSYQVHPFKLLSKTFFIIFSLSSQELMVSEFPG